ncbi:hypothetical protein [Halegenticoccus tardaugens]|uniref:hypothetical protein n=1 Tax=Halegenticoccus tardaugens TaxID=2071624 RepID=UPI00100AABA6|nr:hypothetical protein [Halegenticoccus tardaugens]
MRRRQFLPAVALGTAALSGCGRFAATASDPLTLSSAETEVEDDETHLSFRRDGDRLLVASIRHDVDDDGRFHPFRVSAWHAEGTTLDRVRYRFATLPGDPDHASEVYLNAPGGREFPEMRFRTDRSGRTIVEVDDLGSQGRGTLTTEFVLQTSDRPPRELAVDVEFELSDADGERAYEAADSVLVEL